MKKILLRILTTRVAWPILITIALLCTASVLALSLDSANPDRATRQGYFIVVGVILLCLTLLPTFQQIGHASYVLFAFSILLLVAVFFAPEQKQTHRWFSLPGNFLLQPSEFAKIAFVLAIAWFLRYRRNTRQLTGLFAPFLIALVPFSLILLEPDLGTALLFPLVLYAMLIAAGARLRHLIIVALVAVFAMPGAYPFLKPYQQQRVESIVRRYAGLTDPGRRMNEDFQQHQSVTAIGSGGTTGQGAEAAQQLQQGVLPEAFTDFVYAVIGTQWGFIGSIAILILYLAFFAASVEIASAQKDQFGRLLVVGLASLILFQAFINIAMAIAIGPVVGIALPFVSYGGSSLLTNFLAAGLILNVSLRR